MTTTSLLSLNTVCYFYKREREDGAGCPQQICLALAVASVANVVVYRREC
jgi:hypothetical protein